MVFTSYADLRLWLQVRNVILRALQQSQIDKAAAAAKTVEAAAKAAQVAVERVFEHCLQVRLHRTRQQTTLRITAGGPSNSCAGQAAQVLVAVMCSRSLS